MRGFLFCLSLAATFSLTQTATGTVVFETHSTATQTIASPLFGGAVVITGVGTQVFTIDPSSGFANVASDFKGSDLPNPLLPGGFLTYDLYNTATTGTVTINGSGSYNIDFELRITNGPLSGLTFETMQLATFAASNIPTLPFPIGTAFSDPTPPDTLAISVKFDPTHTFSVGTVIGTSSNRVVTIDGIIVPEPATWLMGAMGAGIIATLLRRKEKEVGSRS